MKAVKGITLLLIIVIGVLVVSRSALKTSDHKSQLNQVIPKVEIVSSIPRYQFGSYGGNRRRLFSRVAPGV
jgi:hypothetical protein